MQKYFLPILIAGMYVHFCNAAYWVEVRNNTAVKTVCVVSFRGRTYTKDVDAGKLVKIEGPGQVFPSEMHIKAGQIRYNHKFGHTRKGTLNYYVCIKGFKGDAFDVFVHEKRDKEKHFSCPA
jgi:hypothetical protein